MTEKYKNPSLTTDIAIFSIIEKNLKVLLIKRKNPPFQDKWAIPGGFVDYNEELETAAKRELKEETKIKRILADEVVECWDIFGEGKLELFEKTGIYCAICTRIDFKDKKIKIDDFPEYLLITRKPNTKYW